MGSSKGKVVTDPIYGHIQLNSLELKVVNTASFQRLRRIKQLGMCHFTFPNATHTRFAHSLGALCIMQRAIEAAEKANFFKKKKYGKRVKENLRLAALLHDVGHYPYSHVMESLKTVVLAEALQPESQEGRSPGGGVTYPTHEELGKVIVTEQEDIRDALGGWERAEEVASIFTRSEAMKAPLSNLISSSLDMDRLDYLMRDAYAAGVPYGRIDIHYILDNFQVSPTGFIGVSDKALPACEQFLMARYFMHRAVYYHKTTVALEEACRQLLVRLCNEGGYGVPRNGEEVIDRVTCPKKLGGFTDAFVDGVVEQASEHRDPLIRLLATAIRRRVPPKLLKEVWALPSWSPGEGEEKECFDKIDIFRKSCRHQLYQLAQKHGLDLRRFLLWVGKPIGFESRPAEMSLQAAKHLPQEREQESIKVFVPDEDEPVSIMDIPHSIISKCSGRRLRVARLYLVRDEGDEDNLYSQLKSEVSGWDRA